MTPEQVAAAWEQYKEQRAAHSRRRRTRIRFSQFAVLSKIGQGGYGQVFLTRKTDTGEVCAVKRMAKAALARRGAVRLPCGRCSGDSRVLTRTAAWASNGAAARPPERTRHDRARRAHGGAERLARAADVRLPGPGLRVPRHGTRRADGRRRSHAHGSRSERFRRWRMRMASFPAGVRARR